MSWKKKASSLTAEGARGLIYLGERRPAVRTYPLSSMFKGTERHPSGGLSYCSGAILMPAFPQPTQGSTSAADANAAPIQNQHRVRTFDSRNTTRNIRGKKSPSSYLHLPSRASAARKKQISNPCALLLLPFVRQKETQNHS